VLHNGLPLLRPAHLHSCTFEFLSTMVNALSICSLLLLSLSVNAATHHNARRSHSRGDVVLRRSTELNSGEPLLQKRDAPAPPSRRLNKRCKSRTTSISSSAPTSTSVSVAAPTTTKAATTVAVGNPGGDPTTKTQPTSTRLHTVTTKAPEPTTKAHTSSKAAPTTSVDSGSGGGNSLLTGTKSGQGTFYATGLNACGGTDQDSDYIAAVSHILYDEFPGATANPNDNPVCGRMVKASRNGKSVTVKITDRCTGCAEFDLDFSPSAFDQLADPDLGRVDITWVWL